MSERKLLEEESALYKCRLLLSDALFCLDDNDIGGAYANLKPLQDMLASIEKSGGWISVEERLPEKNTTCLVFCGWVDVATYEPKMKHPKRKNYSWFVEPAGINPNLNVIYWQPLPPLPGDKG